MLSAVRWRCDVKSGPSITLEKTAAGSFHVIKNHPKVFDQTQKTKNEKKSEKFPEEKKRKEKEYEEKIFVCFDQP